MANNLSSNGNLVVFNVNTTRQTVVVVTFVDSGRAAVGIQIRSHQIRCARVTDLAAAAAAASASTAATATAAATGAAVTAQTRFQHQSGRG